MAGEDLAALRGVAMKRLLVATLLGTGFPLLASPADDYNKGVDAYRRGDFYGAESAFESAARDEKLKGRSLYNLGNARARQGRLDEAIKAYQDALNVDPEEKRAQENLKWAEQLREQKPPEQPQQGQDQDDKQQEQSGEQQQSQDQQAPQQQSSPSEGQQGQRQNSQETPSSADNQKQESVSSEQTSEKNPGGDGGNEATQAARPDGELSREEAERMIDAVPERTGVRSDRKQGGKRGGSTLDW